MTVLSRSVHAAKAASPAASGAAGVNRLFPRSPRRSAPTSDSTVIGTVVEVMGPHAVAVELDHTAAAEYHEEIVLHGDSGWSTGLLPGQRIRTTGEWDLADWHDWPTGERSHYLAIRGRLEFRVATRPVAESMQRSVA